MTITEILLIQLMEECAEVSQRASKALRFGLDEIQKDQGLTNSKRLEYELVDLVAVVELLQDRQCICKIHTPVNALAIKAKHKKIGKYLKLSQELGIASK